MKDGRSQRPADTKKRPIKEASEVLEDETVSIPTPRGVIFLSSIQGERRKQAKTQCLKISLICHQHYNFNQIGPKIETFGNEN